MQREALHLNEYGVASGPVGSSCLPEELVFPSLGLVMPSPAPRGFLL